MDGMGSGGRQHGKCLTTAYKRLDAREVLPHAKREGVAFWQWRDGSCARVTTSHLCAAIETRTPGRHPVLHNVVLEATRQHFGGVRSWWRCPCCHSRVGLLYWEGWQWKCRQCAQLTYPSTRQSSDARAYAKVNKLREALGWGGGLLSPMGGRPKGMHLETYTRLLRQLASASIYAAGEGTRRLERLERELTGMHTAISKPSE